MLSLMGFPIWYVTCETPTKEGNFEHEQSLHRSRQWKGLKAILCFSFWSSFLSF
jgi:hypothetical protein